PLYTRFAYTTLYRSEGKSSDPTAECRLGLVGIEERYGRDVAGAVLAQARPVRAGVVGQPHRVVMISAVDCRDCDAAGTLPVDARSEEHTSELQSPYD